MVVGIIGVLAAVAIPAYQKYQRNAESGVVRSTLTQITKAFPICLTSTNFGACSSDTIDGTLISQTGSSIKVDKTAGKACFKVTNDNGGLTGCVDFLNDGIGKAVNTKVGYPAGTPCQTITRTCSGGDGDSVIGTLGGCPAGCTATQEGTADTCDASNIKTSGGDVDTCGATGTSTAILDTQCSSGVCTN